MEFFDKRYVGLAAFLICCVNSYAYNFEVNGIFYDKLSSNEVEVVQNGNGHYSGEIIIPEKVTYNGVEYTVSAIGNRAFFNCAELTGAIVIPNSIKTIGSFAFDGCSGLTGALTIPNSVTSIGEFAFHECSGLSGSLTISNSLTTIGNGVFSGCSGLTGALTIPNSVTCIGSFAFYNCSGLTGSLIIPKTVTEIGEYAFCQCSGFTGELSLPSGLTEIAKSTFSGCKGLTGSLVIPNTVTSIGESAFYNCSGFTGELSIPSGLTEIANSTFSGCKGLTGSLVIPYSVTTIGESAFEGCSSFNGSLNIPNSVTSIGKYAFNDCSKLTGSLILPNSLTTISNSVFSGCSGFDGTLSIPNSVTSIDKWAFYKCSGLTGTLVIPNSVTSIGDWAFCLCKAINEVISNIESPFDIGTSVFSGISSDAILQVPKGTKKNYESFTGWTTNFKKVIEVGAEVSLSITADGYGTVEYKTNAIKNQAKSFSLEYGTSATLYFFPDNGYKIGSVKLNNKDITSDVVNYLQYTIKGIEENISVVVTFESISGTQYALMISANGNGYAYYNGSVTREDANTYIVKAGSSPQVYFTPDDGYRTAKVLENSVDVTSKVLYNSYTVSNISKNTIISVWFEEKPITTYTLSIKTKGNGSVTYDNTTWKNETKTFTVNEGSYATIAVSPESGYRLKSILVDSKDVTSEVSNNLYSVSSITKNTTVEVEFEAIPIPTYTLTVTATGKGIATISGATIRNQTRTFTLNEGTNVVVTFTPDNGNSIKSVKVNDADITASVTGNRYVIEALTANTTIRVTFVEDVNALTVDGVNYSVISQSEKTIKLMGGNIGQVLTVPATITQNETTWKVTDIDKEALKNNAELAAIIWEPDVAFTATVSNPNLLLYVKDSQYAPESIRNVVVNGYANEIALFDAASGNGFYCPQAFTTTIIVYAHNYSMETGVGSSKGWETITLPFDVQSIYHQTKGIIVPFARWKEGDTAKPFWLYELTGVGFTEAESIKAYTPYIISMPNNPKYDDEWQLNGEVTFSAMNVTIEPTNDLKIVSFQERTFVPNYTDKPANEGLYGLNVVNDYSSNNSGMTDGSKFVLNMRQIHPFEAYMTTTSNSRHAIGIFDDMTTAIHEIETKMEAEKDAFFDLQGRKLNVPRKGVYIKNGKKYIKK